MDDERREAARLLREAAAMSRWARELHLAGRVGESLVIAREAVALQREAVELWEQVLARQREATGYDPRQKVRDLLGGMLGEAGE
jgi:hypothetical protein